MASLLLALMAGAAVRGQEVAVEQEITFGQVGDAPLQLDLARPAEGSGPFPAVVFIHGGGWYKGERQLYRAAITEAAKRGYVAVTISYRLMQFDEAAKETGTAAPIFPAQLHDAKAAVRWLRANSARYLLDPQRIGVVGFSAGGTLALLIGLTEPVPALEGNAGNPDHSSRVQAVASVFGPTDMLFSFERGEIAWVIRLFLGGTPQEVPEQYKMASPLLHVTPNDPPVMTIHGARDAFVPLPQIRALDDALEAAGVPHTMVIYEDQGHGFTPEYEEKAYKAIWGFLDKYLKK